MTGCGMLGDRPQLLNHSPASCGTVRSLCCKIRLISFGPNIRLPPRPSLARTAPGLTRVAARQPQSNRFSGQMVSFNVNSLVATAPPTGPYAGRRFSHFPPTDARIHPYQPTRRSLAYFTALRHTQGTLIPRWRRFRDRLAGRTRNSAADANDWRASNSDALALQTTGHHQAPVPATSSRPTQRHGCHIDMQSASLPDSLSRGAPALSWLRDSARDHGQACANAMASADQPHHPPDFPGQ